MSTENKPLEERVLDLVERDPAVACFIFAAGANYTHPLFDPHTVYPQPFFKWVDRLRQLSRSS